MTRALLRGMSGDERLRAAYARAQETWKRAYDLWVKANETVESALTDMQGLRDKQYSFEKEAAHRARLQVDLDLAKTIEAAARMRLSDADTTWRDVADQLRWAEGHSLQKSAMWATWVMAIVGAAALGVSAWATWAGSRPPPPAQIQIAPTPGSCPEPGPWRPDVLSR